MIPNIRTASVRDDIGIVAVEFEGAPDRIQAAREWLEGLGVDVEPVELNVIE